MTMNSRISASLAKATRRSFVTLAAVGAAMSFVGLTGFRPRPEVRLDDQLSSLYRHVSSAGKVGQRVNEMFPADRTTLRARLLADLGMAPQSAVVPDLNVLRRRAAARIRDDFSAERTVIVDGWLLSETEARLCAFAAKCRS